MASKALGGPKTVDDYLAMPYHFDVYREENADGSYWVARVPELRWCAGDGETPEAAVACAREHMSLWIADALADGEAIPEPGATMPEKFSLRLPKVLHRDISRRAQQEGVSLNTWVATVLARHGA